jgi:hypothetical protein
VIWWRGMSTRYHPFKFYVSPPHLHSKADHAPFNKMGSRLWQRKLTWRGGRGPGAVGGGEEGEAGGRAAGPMLEMRTLGSGGGFVDPHY